MIFGQTTQMINNSDRSTVAYYIIHIGWHVNNGQGFPARFLRYLELSPAADPRT